MRRESTDSSAMERGGTVALERERRVREIRQLIREHRYESSRKLEIAITRLLGDLDD